jgi:hypothetical protein
MTPASFRLWFATCGLLVLTYRTGGPDRFRSESWCRISELSLRAGEGEDLRGRCCGAGPELRLRLFLAFTTSTSEPESSSAPADNSVSVEDSRYEVAGFACLVARPVAALERD